MINPTLCRHCGKQLRDMIRLASWQHWAPSCQFESDSGWHNHSGLVRLPGFGSRVFKVFAKLIARRLKSWGEYWMHSSCCVQQNNSMLIFVGISQTLILSCHVGFIEPAVTAGIIDLSIQDVSNWKLSWLSICRLSDIAFEIKREFASDRHQVPSGRGCRHSDTEWVVQSESDSGRRCSDYSKQLFMVSHWFHFYAFCDSESWILIAMQFWGRGWNQILGSKR